MTVVRSDLNTVARSSLYHMSWARYLLSQDINDTRRAIMIISPPRGQTH